MRVCFRIPRVFKPVTVASDESQMIKSNFPSIKNNNIICHKLCFIIKFCFYSIDFIHRVNKNLTEVMFLEERSILQYIDFPKVKRKPQYRDLGGITKYIYIYVLCILKCVTLA